MHCVRVCVLAHGLCAKRVCLRVCLRVSLLMVGMQCLLLASGAPPRAMPGYLTSRFAQHSAHPAARINRALTACARAPPAHLMCPMSTHAGLCFLHRLAPMPLDHSTKRPRRPTFPIPSHAPRSCRVPPPLLQGDPGRADAEPRGAHRERAAGALLPLAPAHEAVVPRGACLSVRKGVCVCKCACGCVPWVWGLVCVYVHVCVCACVCVCMCV